MKESTIYIVDIYTTLQQNRSLQVKFYWVVVEHIIVLSGSNDHGFPCNLLLILTYLRSAVGLSA